MSPEQADTLPLVHGMLVVKRFSESFGCFVVTNTAKKSLRFTIGDQVWCSRLEQLTFVGEDRFLIRIEDVWAHKPLQEVVEGWIDEQKELNQSILQTTKEFVKLRAAAKKQTPKPPVCQAKGSQFPRRAD